MSDEMIERVERAVANALSLTPAAARVATRAAIEAMREPTAAMVKAAGETGFVENGEYSISMSGCREVWCAMIDAALGREIPP